MKHLKPFNESIDDEIKNEIRQSVEDCFLDYTTDYGMKIQFVDGFYVPGYHFMSERLLDGTVKNIIYLAFFRFIQFVILIIL